MASLVTTELGYIGKPVSCLDVQAESVNGQPMVKIAKFTFTDLSTLGVFQSTSTNKALPLNAKVLRADITFPTPPTAQGGSLYSLGTVSAPTAFQTAVADVPTGVNGVLSTMGAGTFTTSALAVDPLILTVAGATFTGGAAIFVTFYYIQQ